MIRVFIISFKCFSILKYLSRVFTKTIIIQNIVDPDPKIYGKVFERRDTGDGVLELMLHPAFSEDD